jgi:hypothetical protein
MTMVEFREMKNVGGQKGKVEAGPQNRASHDAPLLLGNLNRNGFRVACFFGSSSAGRKRMRLLEDLAHAGQPHRVHHALVSADSDE